MALFKKIEELAAKKLMRLFLDSKKYADNAIDDLNKAEKELEQARIKAAEATQKQHKPAAEAAKKAKMLADELANEAQIAEYRARHYEKIIKNSKET